VDFQFPGQLQIKALDDDECFFSGQRTDASRIKSRIVVDTFLGWAGVLLNQNPLALWYIDLYCGKGIYQDGSPSTPLELFSKVVADSRLAQRVRMVFNDRKPKYVFELRDHIMGHEKYPELAHPPRFQHGEVDEGLVADLNAQRPRPFSFAFIDPFGYKGVTRELIQAVLADFGCDVLFFFSYHAIKRVLANPNAKLRSHVEALLGVDAVRELRVQFSESRDERENERAVLQALRSSMKQIEGRDVLSFAFRRRSGHASHHLVFVSKRARGFKVAKEVMARASTWRTSDGVPSFEYIPPGYDNRLEIDPQAPSIEQLMALLVHRCGGQILTLEAAYDAVLFGTPYVKENVRIALLRFVKEFRSEVYSKGAISKLRGTLLPHAASVAIPRTLRRL